MDDRKLQALREYAAAITRNRGRVSEAQVDACKAAGFDNRAILDLLVGAATKLISNDATHLADPPQNDAFMAGAEWTPPGRLPAAA